MGRFPKDCLNCLKKAWRQFRAREVTVLISKEPVTQLTPPTPKAPAKESGSIFLSRGRVSVSEEYLDGDSHTYESIPLSGQDRERGLCILLPWYWQGHVERAEIVTKKRTFPLVIKSWETAAECYKKFPNGARVFLRTENQETGEQIGCGTLRVRDRDGQWWEYNADFSTGMMGWGLKRAIT